MLYATPTRTLTLRTLTKQVFDVACNSDENTLVENTNYKQVLDVAYNSDKNTHVENTNSASIGCCM